MSHDPFDPTTRATPASQRFLEDRDDGQGRDPDSKGVETEEGDTVTGRVPSTEGVHDGPLCVRDHLLRPRVTRDTGGL